MNKAKAKAQRRHAKARAASRYGLWLTSEDLWHLGAQIEGKNCRRVYRQSNRVSHYEVHVQGIKALVVYDHQRQEIVTFLPRVE